jgi:hypothetical protein
MEADPYEPGNFWCPCTKCQHDSFGKPGKYINVRTAQNHRQKVCERMGYDAPKPGVDFFDIKNPRRLDLSLHAVPPSSADMPVDPVVSAEPKSSGEQCAKSQISCSRANEQARTNALFLRYRLRPVDGTPLRLRTHLLLLPQMVFASQVPLSSASREPTVARLIKTRHLRHPRSISMTQIGRCGCTTGG